MDKIRKEDLQKLINHKEEPCISLYMSTTPQAGNEVNKMSIQYKNLLKKAREELKINWKKDDKEIDKLLGQAREISQDRSFWFNQTEGLAVFISPETFLFYRVPIDFEDKVIVSKYFNIKQLIPELFEDRRYFVLTLSRQHNSLYQCTPDSITPIEIENTPANIDETLQYDDPEENIQYHSGNSSEAIFHGQGVTNEDNKEDLMRYLRQIDQGLNTYLHNKEDPLVVISVKDLFPLYKKANSYSNLLDDFVHGNPENMKLTEIQHNTKDIIEPYFQNYKKEALEKFNENLGTEKSESDINEIIPGTVHGRVDLLLLKADKDEWGIYNHEEQEVRLLEDIGYYDLYNYAALNTIANGGNVYLLEPELMPDNVDIGAVYRY